MNATPDLFPQASLPETEPAPAHETAAELPPDALFAQVVFNKPLTQLFTYFVPKASEPFIAVGKRVAVPFGKGDKAAAGYCVELTRQRPERAVKSVRHVLDEEPLLTPTLLKWTRWLADYYL